MDIILKTLGLGIILMMNKGIEKSGIILIVDSIIDLVVNKL